MKEYLAWVIGFVVLLLIGIWAFYSFFNNIWFIIVMVALFLALLVKIFMYLEDRIEELEKRIAVLTDPLTEYIADDKKVKDENQPQ